MTEKTTLVGPPASDYGVFEGSILLTAQPVTEADKKLLTAEQLEALDRNGGFIVGVQVRGQLNAHGLGRALGSALKCYINEVARGLNQPAEKVAPHAIQQVLGPMMYYAGVGESIWSGKIQ